jgi:hypothetical protein
MSQAFVKEGEEQWLHDIPPTMTALVNYLTRENNGIRVYEKETALDKTTTKLAHKMSNGLTYTIGSEGKWEILY